MPTISIKAGSFGESVIRRMTRVANEHGAVNLSQGFPDFDPPPELLEAGARAMRDGPHQYAVTWGAPNFREALAAKQSRFLGIPIDPGEHVTATCGATEAMLAALLATVDPGDRVVVFSPFYENYLADCVLAGARPVCVALRPPEFSFDPAELERAMDGARALILCNPANPTGKVFTREELSLVAELAERHDAVVVTDEVYEHIVYPPREHVWFSALPGMFDRTVSCGSLSKTYSVTGWRLGYVIAPRRITEAVRKVHDFLTVGAAAPLQEAAVTALRFPDSYYEGLRDAYARRRELFLSLLEESGLPHVKPDGAYYVLADIRGLGARDDVEFAEWMAREVGVAAVPGSSFFRETVRGYVRFHFAKREETLREAGCRLAALRDRWREKPGRQ